MQKETSKRPPWLLFRLLGVDVAVAVYAWVIVFARLFDVIDIAYEPIFLLCMVVWILVFVKRYIRYVINGREDSIGYQAAFFRENIFLISLILFCSFLTVFWLGWCQVGGRFLKLLILPVLSLGVSVSLSFLLRMAGRALLQSWAFAVACASPSWLYCSYANSEKMFFSSPVLVLTVLMTLFIFLERINDSPSSKTLNTLADIFPVGLFALVIYCAVRSSQCASHEIFFYYAVAMGAAFLQILCHLRKRLSKESVVALTWPLLALSALGACVLF